MKRSLLWSGALGTGGLAWVASAELRWPARLVAAVLLGPLPLLFMLQARAAESLTRPLPRIPVYVGSIAGLWLLAAICMAAGIASGFTPRIMGFYALPVAAFLVWLTFALLASGAVVTLFKALGSTEADIMREITPVTTTEKAVFVLLSISAGVCEEVSFRGFLLPALAVATSSVLAGAVLSSLAFGILHAHQRAAGAYRAALLGLVLAVPVVITGSVYPSMVAHAIVDIVGGLWLARWLFR